MKTTASLKLKHTPGPWEVCKHFNGRMWIYGVRNALFGAPVPAPDWPRIDGVSKVEQGIYGSSWNTNNPADAHLIAAAPELLAATEALMNAVFARDDVAIVNKGIAAFDSAMAKLKGGLSC